MTLAAWAVEPADWQVKLIGREKPVTLRKWMGRAPCAFVAIARGDARTQPDLISRGADEGFWPLPPPTMVPRMVLVLDDGPLPEERLLGADWGRPTDATAGELAAVAQGTLYVLGQGGQALAVFAPRERNFSKKIESCLQAAAEQETVEPKMLQWLGKELWTAETANGLINEALLRYANDPWESRWLITDTCAWLADQAGAEDPEARAAMFAGAIQTLMSKVPRERNGLETFARQWRERAAGATREYELAQIEAALVLARIEAGHQAVVKNDPRWLLLAGKIALMDPAADARVWLTKALQHPRLTPELREECERLLLEVRKG